MSVENGQIPLESFAGAMNNWQRSVYSGAELTPKRRACRAYEEVGELDAVLDSGDNELILGEAVDATIGMLGISLTVATPQEVAGAMFDKLMVILRKYPSYEVQRLRSQGLTTNSALAHLKDRWNQQQSP